MTTKILIKAELLKILLVKSYVHDSPSVSIEFRKCT